MNKTAILVIHGIGDNEPNFADDFKNLIAQNTLNIDNVEVKVFPCYWKDLIRNTEDSLDKQVTNLKYKILRKFMIEFVGDATAYQLSDDNNDFYRAVHGRVNETLEEINEWLEDDGNLIWVGHSLGTVITSNFIWDAQVPSSDGNKYFQASDNAKLALNKLDSLFTLGSPLLVWSLQDNKDFKPVTVNRWLNIYSKYDVIGYPIKDINDNYRNDKNITDYELSVGGIISKYSPLCHVDYLCDSTFIDIIIGETQLK